MVGFYPRVFTLLRALQVCAPLPPVGNSLKPVSGPDEAVPALSRPGERAKPAPKRMTSTSEARRHCFEGQHQDRRAIAERVATYGLKVFCTRCGLMHRHRTIGGDRLRNLPSPCCGARMRPARWKGWDEWRHRSRDTRAEEPVPLADAHVVRVGRHYYMRGLDS